MGPIDLRQGFVHAYYYILGNNFVCLSFSQKGTLLFRKNMHILTCDCVDMSFDNICMYMIISDLCISFGLFLKTFLEEKESAVSLFKTLKFTSKIVLSGFLLEFFGRVQIASHCTTSGV